MVGFSWSFLTLALGFIFSFSSSFEADFLFEKPPLSNRVHDSPCLNNQAIVVCYACPALDTFFEKNAFSNLSFNNTTVFGVLKFALLYFKKGFGANVHFTGFNIVYPFHFFL